MRIRETGAGPLRLLALTLGGEYAYCYFDNSDARGWSGAGRAVGRRGDAWQSGRDRGEGGSAVSICTDLEGWRGDAGALRSAAVCRANRSAQGRAGQNGAA